MSASDLDRNALDPAASPQGNPTNSFELTDPHEPVEEVQDLHEPIIREREEPKDGYEPVPIALLAVFAVLLFWGGSYLQRFSGNFDSSVLTDSPELASLSEGTSFERKPLNYNDPNNLDELIALGKIAYGSCRGCHQDDGLGREGQYPPLVGSEWVIGDGSEASTTGNGQLSLTVSRLNRILLHGLNGPLEVSGVTYEGNMPAWGQQLSSDQIAGVLTYIRQEWGNDAPPIYPAMIEATEAKVGTRNQPWSQSELLAVAEGDDYTEPDIEAPVQLASGGSLTEPKVYSDQAWEQYAIRLVDAGKADPAHGQEVFGLDVLNCKGCHKVAGTAYNGNVGPELSQIGNVFPPKELAKHIMYPSVRIHPDYKPVLVATFDGVMHDGVLARENNDELVILKSDGTTVRVAQDDIDARQDPDKSLMPEGLPEKISAKDYADLIAYLYTLK